MKAKDMALMALVVAFSGLFVSGCDLVWDVVGWAAVSENMDSILMRKYGLTSWIWWVAAICSLYLPMRTTETRTFAALSGLPIGVLCLTIILWQWLSWVALVVAFFGLFFLAMPILIITKVIGWLRAAGKQGKKVVDSISKDAEQVTRQKGVKAEKKINEAWIRLFVFGLAGTLVWVLVLFGGELYPPTEDVTGWHHFDLILRIVGSIFAVISLVVFIHDARHSYWECPQCERTIFDWFRNKELCPHKGCGFFNPWVSWVCEAKIDGEKCLFENSGDVLRCEECGTPRRGSKKWLAILEDDEDEDDDIIDAEFTEHHDDPPPPRRQLPPPTPETITCRNCGNEIPADARACGRCGTPTKPAGNRKPSQGKPAKRRNPADKYL